MLAEETTFYSRLVAEWRANARPLILADEVRIDDLKHKEIISFVFVCTDTRTATDLAEEAEAIRARMQPVDARALFKGSHLYGNNHRSCLDDFRNYVEAAIRRCPVVVCVTTTSSTITCYRSIAPGGIRRQVANSGDRELRPIAGRELVPFMNMLKLVATAMRAGDNQIDVLLDRSFNLGLDPGQLGIDKNSVAVIGPGKFNQRKDGSAAAFNCPSSFQLICPPKHSPFRDLLLLPDAIGYRLRPKLPEMRDALDHTHFYVQIWPEETKQECMATVNGSFSSVTIA